MMIEPAVSQPSQISSPTPGPFFQPNKRFKSVPSEGNVSVALPDESSQKALNPSLARDGLLKMRRDFKFFAKSLKAEQLLKAKLASVADADDRPTFFFGQLPGEDTTANETTQDVLAGLEGTQAFWKMVESPECGIPTPNGVKLSSNSDATETDNEDEVSQHKVESKLQVEAVVTTLSGELSRSTVPCSMPNTLLYSGRKNVTERQTYAGLKTMPPGSYRRYKVMS